MIGECQKNCHIFLITVLLMIIRIAVVVGNIISSRGVCGPSHEMKVASYTIA